MYKPAKDLQPADRFHYAGEPHIVTGPSEPGALFKWLLHIPVRADSGLVYTITLPSSSRVMMMPSDNDQPGATT